MLLLLALLVRREIWLLRDVLGRATKEKNVFARNAMQCKNIACSLLLLIIEASNHSAILSVLRLSTMSISIKLIEEELTEFCRSESLSLDGLREIIERHQNQNIDDPCIDNNYKFFFHEACYNERLTEGILRCLIKYFPNAARYADNFGRLPLHRVCENKNVTLGMVHLLIDAFPDSLNHQNNNGMMPLLKLCYNKNLDEEIAVDILKVLLERCPESVRHATIYGMLPFHVAALWQSPVFCHILIEAYPRSERMASDSLGMLPFHWACQCSNVPTAKYLYQLYPESIYVTDRNGAHPIHHAIMGLKNRSNPKDGIEVVKFLLDCNPNVALQELHGKLPLYWVCNWATNDDTERLNARLKVLQILYDAHPDAIEDNEVTSNVDGFCAEVQRFINTNITYARQARDRTLMTTRDENGRLPLHRALRDNITLGSIKLLVKGNPSAISCNDNIGMMLLHVACQLHETPAVVEYLINLDPTSLHRKDLDDNTALHYACRGANHAIIAILLDKYGAISVSKRNAHGQLPIDLLFASREVSHRESVEHTESIFRLLRAYPATVMNCILNTTTSHPDSNMSGKKRKIDNIH